ncbi:5-oxoprolinase subunit PxpA [Maribacter sp. 1_MG-2023]|uniref:5-oxoprolinase subunit PxpA n=1 Tax=Maribacter sp. 1_MG-2023 TaxID=3062677 RepID=UPI0026E12999|nr:5-oxoprolinase subunit PxpA [Maribacter sp. 1_MG-2023]MDO6471822.1 5-oxoprolinase subunit PxpA [Maribacter sp. 1_MG-2023]
MTKHFIDINCDVGEGIGNEEALFPLISSCNIACGGHAGSKESMVFCLKLAKKFNVKVGAHPSYPDRENFGRVSMTLSEDELILSIKQQMHLFVSLCSQMDIELHHIKPHGALYNDIAKDEHLAKTFLTGIEEFKKGAVLYVPYGSVIQRLALEYGFKVLVEAFADRNYNTDLSLVSRKESNALITDGKEVLAHLLRMYYEKEVKTVSGDNISIIANTYCIHGDTPSVLKILAYLSDELPHHNLLIKS